MSENIQQNHGIVTITMIDHTGQKRSVEISDNKSILEAFEDANIELPYSCRAGACVTCLAKVEHGAECIDVGKFSVPLVDINEDEVLTCIAGVKSSCCNDGISHNIMLKSAF